ncbi:MAG: DNA mismatch repair endonuclease MutL [Proteobacteria bacterium]|nr:DNA mismatch repair endonuclease MutL [Pseudomonadota bacterium]
MRIHRLPTIVANQIAAGEVIERPASIVKELLENSLDAGARRIEVDIEKGGVQLIRIRDDGVGIFKEDLELAVSRHATSKIQELKDLEHIASLGFRGEALASISSISRFSLSSKAIDQEAAWKIQVEGRELETAVEPIAHPQGTTIEVRDLFFNTPARRKFLRGEKTEFDHIEEVIRRIALSRFEVSFSLNHHDKKVFHLLSATDDKAWERRVEKLFGSQFLQHSVALDATASGLRLWGWCASPEFLRSSSDLQFFYVNGRMVRDKVIMHAIRQAYQDLLYSGRQPAYILYLELDPTLVDVNVHPTKHEVRFRETRLVHDFIVSTLSKALGPKNSGSVAAKDVIYASHREYPEAYSKPFQRQIREESAIYHSLGQSTEDVSQGYLGKAMATLHKRYILAEHKTGLMIVDYVLAHQQLLYQQLLSDFQNENSQSRTLSVPITISLDESQVNLAIKFFEQLSLFGIVLESLGKQTLILRKIPNRLAQANAQQMVLNVIEYLSSRSEIHKEEFLELLSEQVSKVLEETSLSQLNQILRELEENIRHSPKSFYKQITLDSL